MIMKAIISMHEYVASLACICPHHYHLTSFMLPQVCKRDDSSNASKDIKQKQKQVGSKTEMSQMTISTSKTSNE